MVPSSIASRNPDWVRAGMRLISSTSTTLPKTGPGMNSNRPRSGRQTEEPVTSVGSRSAVPWMRLNLPPSALRDRLGQRRLAGARQVLDQHVPAGEHGADQRLHHRQVSEQHPVDRA